MASLVLSLVLTPELGLEGPALATAVPFAVAFPVLVRVALAASGASLSELAARAWAPNYLLGAVLAALLVAPRVVLDPDSLLAVADAGRRRAARLLGAFYGLVLDREERALARGLVMRAR